jgi:hypothetical protein
VDRADEAVADLYVGGQWVATVRLTWRGRPDLTTVERLARIGLHARRNDGELRVRSAPGDLVALAELTGLADHLFAPVAGEPGEDDAERDDDGQFGLQWPDDRPW